MFKYTIDVLVRIFYSRACVLGGGLILAAAAGTAVAIGLTQVTGLWLIGVIGGSFLVLFVMQSMILPRLAWIISSKTDEMVQEALEQPSTEEKAKFILEALRYVEKGRYGDPGKWHGGYATLFPWRRSQAVSILKHVTALKSLLGKLQEMVPKIQEFEKARTALSEAREKGSPAEVAAAELHLKQVELRTQKKFPGDPRWRSTISEFEQARNVDISKFPGIGADLYWMQNWPFIVGYQVCWVLWVLMCMFAFS